MTVAESGRYPRSIVEKIGVLAGQMRAGRVCRCAVAVLVVVVGLLWIELGVAEATVGQPAQDEFVPLEQVSPEDQLPAAPLLITGYAIIWILVLGYLWSIWRRMSAVEREIDGLLRRSSGGRGPS